MKDSLVAQKYAKALFAQALVKKEVLACQQGLEQIVRVARARKKFLTVLEHPFILVTEKRRMIHSALGEYATPLLERFLSLLVERKRVALLIPIQEAFQEEVDRHQNVQSVRVRSAFRLDEAHERRLKEDLKKWLRAEIRLEVDVDPSLIGGIVIQTRDQISDQSLRGKLERLKEQLVG